MEAAHEILILYLAARLGVVCASGNSPDTEIFVKSLINQKSPMDDFGCPRLISIGR